MASENARPKVVTMEPVAHHNLVKHTNDRLSIVDAETNETLVAARRQDGIWYISADGVADTFTPHLHEADDGVIKKMTDHALAHKKAVLGADEYKALMAGIGHPDTEGFSTWVPHEVRKLHGKDSFDAWKASVGLHQLTY